MKTKILIILALLTVLTSCDKKIGRCDLTEAQKQVIPYELGQTVSFIDDAGKTVDFTVTENELRWCQFTIDGRLGDSYVEYREKHAVLKSESNNLVIDLRIAAIGGLSEKKNEVLTGYVNSWFWITINSYGRFQLIVDPEGVFSNAGSSPLYFHDSFEINEKVYFDVIEKNTYDDTNAPLQIFYNKTYGILQVKKEGENILMLKD